MRCLERNKTAFEYLPYMGVVEDVTEDGDHTGEYHEQYGTAVPYKGNISVPSGHTNQAFYGEDIRYTHTLVMDDPNVDINEYGLIRWKGELYDITAVRRSLNAVSVAMKKQTVDHPDTYVPENTDGEG